MTLLAVCLLILAIVAVLLSPRRGLPLAFLSVVLVGLATAAFAATPGDPGAPAQVAAPGSAIPWGTIVQAGLAIVGAVLTWIFARLTGSMSASSAQGQLVTLADAVRQKVWDSLTDDVQGKIAAGDWKSVQGTIVAAVQKAVLDAVGQGAITSIAKALNLPAASIIGTVATYVIEHFLAAHDPSVSAVSANVYPVSTPIALTQTAQNPT